MSSQETGVIRMADLSPEYAEIMVLGKVLQMSGYFTDVRDQAQAVTKILYGRELGFSPIIAMSGIHIIEGKPALSANLLAATIKRSGKYNYRVKEWDDQHCVITFKEKVEGKWEDVGDSSFSIEDAKRARVKFEGAKGPSGWTKFPKAMLFARALSQGERAYCPDVSACTLYVPEELGAVVNENGDVAELPKGRSTAVTTEDIPLNMPATPPKLTATVKEVEAPAKDIIGDDVARELFRASELADQGAGRNGFVDDPPEWVTNTPQDYEKEERAAIQGEHIQYCSKSENTSFFANIRTALPEPLKVHAETLGRQFLKHKGYTKASGEGSLKSVEKALFPELMKETMVYVDSVKATLRPNSHGVLVSDKDLPENL